MKLLYMAHNYLRNYVRVEVRGTDPRRFLNDCVRSGIDVWDIGFVSENSLRFTLPAADFRGCRAMLRKSACTVRIIRRAGAHYSVRKALRRPVFIFFAAVFAALCFLINSMVLSFDFTGYETVTPRRLMETMEKNGLKIGSWKRNIDASDLRNYIITDIPELIWFTVTFHGCQAHVDVREREPVPALVDDTVVCDIISDVHAVVQDVSLYKGRAEVKKGDIVAPGSMLVSGNTKLRLDEREISVHASADILADVWYKTTLVYPSSSPAKAATGRKKTRWALVFGKKRINFYKKDGKVFDNYDKIIKRYTLSAGDLSLPVFLVKESYEEYETYACGQDEIQTAADAQALIGLANRKTLSLDVGVELTNSSARQSDGLVYAYSYGICRRYIGQTVARQ